jgi:hypothetical protein
MKNRLRYLLFVFFFGFLLLLGLVFPQFVLANILLPAATTVWLLLRIFVLSIHQRVFWWGVILLAAIAAFYGLYLRSAADSRILDSDSNPAPDRASAWRDSILLNLCAVVNEDLFRRDLMWLFTYLYSSRQQGKAKYQIREEILEHRIPIPESIYTFLFFSPPPATKRSFVKHPAERLRVMIASFMRAVQKWVRRRTSRESSDRARSIDDVLTFMETSLEMRQDYDAPEVHRMS